MAQEPLQLLDLLSPDVLPHLEDREVRPEIPLRLAAGMGHEPGADTRRAIPTYTTSYRPSLGRNRSKAYSPSCPRWHLVDLFARLELHTSPDELELALGHPHS